MIAEKRREVEEMEVSIDLVESYKKMKRRLEGLPGFDGLLGSLDCL